MYPLVSAGRVNYVSFLPIVLVFLQLAQIYPFHTPCFLQCMCGETQLPEQGVGTREARAVGRPFWWYLRQLQRLVTLLKNCWCICSGAANHV